MGGNQIASGAGQILCTYWPKETRAKCLEYYTKSKAVGDLFINAAAGIMKACGISP
jgi:hypothetical protein